MRALKVVGTVALWVVQVLASAAFVAAGIAKFGSPAWPGLFSRWGYPDGFYLVIGALEVGGALLLLVPKVSSYGAVLLGAIMVGAAVTHALHNETARLSGPLMLLAIVTLVGLARRRRAWRPGGRALPVAASHV